jgi:hypothetical protein
MIYLGIVVILRTFIILIPCSFAIVRNDATLLKVPVILNDASQANPHQYSLTITYTQALTWRKHVGTFCSSLNITNKCDPIINHVHNQLDKLGFPLNILNNTIDSDKSNNINGVRPRLTSQMMIKRILERCKDMYLRSSNINTDGTASIDVPNDRNDLFYDFFYNSKDLAAYYNPTIYQHLLADIYNNISFIIEPTIHSMLPRHLLENISPTITIYQTQNAYTGGTTAMRVLANTLTSLGYPVRLCNSTNANSDICRHPSGKQYYMAIILHHHHQCLHI